MDLLPLDPQLTNGQKVLVVDDDLDLAQFIVEMIKELGLHAIHAENGQHALSLVSQGSPSIVLTDLMMPDISGSDLLKTIKKSNPTIPVIIMSVINSVESAVDLLKCGADDYITKPLDFAVLRDRLEAVAKKAANARNLEELKQLIDHSFSSHDGLVWGTSQAMLRVAAQVPRIAQTNASVLIHGESGTGKELVARAIHFSSKRAKGPMISISCASIPDGLWERELFGHVKGAFSDSGSGGPGVVEAAHEGTLFLDEVGEIPLQIQPKLLRFLQEKEYRPVGSTKLKEADVRIVAATNRDLKKEAAEGRFREDLFYRLNVLQLELPSLRERKEDIPHLASFFLNRYSEEFDKPAHGFSPRAIQRLSSYDFPGNVRELENVVQQALVTAKHSVVIANDIPVGDRSITDIIVQASPLELAGFDRTVHDQDCLMVSSDLPYTEAKKQLNEAFERLYVRQLLSSFNGNVSRAAAAAGLPRKSLSRIMKRHSIPAGPKGRGGVPGRPRLDSTET